MKLEAAKVDGKPEPKQTEGLGPLVIEGQQGQGQEQGQRQGEGHSLSLNLTHMKDLTPITHFEKSPINKKLHIPHKNADGSPNRCPPDPREVFLREKKKKKHEQKKAYLKSLGLLDGFDNRDEVGHDELTEDGQQPQGHEHDYQSGYDNDNGNNYTNANDDISESPSQFSDTSLQGSSSINSEKLRMRENWGYHPMRAKSAHSGNIPSLPFLGPPYIVDLKTEQHYKTAYKIFSSKKMNSNNMNKFMDSEISMKEKEKEKDKDKDKDNRIKSINNEYKKGKVNVKNQRILPTTSTSLWGKFQKSRGTTFDREGLLD
jgi:hypothetical protein